MRVGLQVWAKKILPSYLVSDKDSENTKKLTKHHRLIFESYLKEKNIRKPSTAVELGADLRKFYAEARKKDGQMYSKNSLCFIRFVLCRHFKQELNIDIIKDMEFNEANRVYEAQCVELKKQGLAKTEHKPPILFNKCKKENTIFKWQTKKYRLEMST